MSNSQIVLHNYFRSSASYRVRIALNLKGLPYEYVPVHLNRNGGEQFETGFKKLNPQALVPVLSDDDFHISQSLAILEYLEEKYPSVPLLPPSTEGRAYVRQISLAIACDIHPLNNLRVLKFLSGPLALTDDARNTWVNYWLDMGLSALEAELENSSERGRFCFGDSPTFADICLIPQLFNAQRFNVDLSAYPTLQQINTECQNLRAFALAHPSQQPDSE